MPFDIGTLGMQAAGGAVGGMLGLALQGSQDRRQIRQQGKLQELQIAGQKEMSEFQLQQQMKLWEATNYKAQMEQMRIAGVNPALLYGMSGGGGSTAAAASGSVGGGQAAGHTGEAIAAGGMGIQLGMQAAQQELIRAQAENLKADTENKRGVERTEGEARIESIGQGINNAIIQGRIMKLEEELKQVNLNVEKGTQEEKIMTISHIAAKLAAEVTMAEAQNMIDQATKEAKIQTIRTQAITALITNVAMRQKIQVDKAQIQTWATQLSQGWENLSQKGQQLRIEEFKANLQAKNPSLANVLGGVLSGALDEISDITTGRDPKFEQRRKVNP